MFTLSLRDSSCNGATYHDYSSSYFCMYIFNYPYKPSSLFVEQRQKCGHISDATTASDLSLHCLLYNLDKYEKIQPTPLKLKKEPNKL